MTKFKKTVEVVPMYCPANDRTFLMEETRIGGILIREKLVSWYYGEPNEISTRVYSEPRNNMYEAIHMSEEDAINTISKE